MLFSGSEPDDVARLDFFDRGTLALNPTTTGGNDKRLPEWMRVPVGTSSRLEGDESAKYARRITSLKPCVKTYRAGEIVR